MHLHNFQRYLMLSFLLEYIKTLPSARILRFIVTALLPYEQVMDGKSDQSKFIAHIVPYLSDLLFSDIGATLTTYSRKQQTKFDRAFRTAGILFVITFDIIIFYFLSVNSNSLKTISESHALLFRPLTSERVQLGIKFSSNFIYAISLLSLRALISSN